ncbi:hypothetical protein BMF94_4122 [Rhodotorula taiwanensis]|uniref:Uncharacterized protein n=1 Tax=Rhodotorula taiwanensis TaxID=741276 RepID=A0A2S5B7Y0_9BASI|nr:hypothetical protein BMF94_4122 [Rhodotorula taiwanensis]
MEAPSASSAPAEAATGGPLSHEPHLDPVRPKEWEQPRQRGDPAKRKPYEFLVSFLPNLPTRQQLQAEGLDCFVWAEDDPTASAMYKRVSPRKGRSTSQPREKGKGQAENDESDQAPEEPAPKKPRVQVDLAALPKPPKITMWAGEVARVKGWGSNGLQQRPVDVPGAMRSDRERAEKASGDEFAVAVSAEPGH